MMLLAGLASPESDWLLGDLDRVRRDAAALGD